MHMHRLFKLYIQFVILSTRMRACTIHDQLQCDSVATCIYMGRALTASLNFDAYASWSRWTSTYVWVRSDDWGAWAGRARD